MIEHQREGTCYLQFRHYQQFPELIQGIFTRQGGYSQPPYTGLNTSTSLKGGDSIDDVIANRQLTLKALEITDYPSVSLWQIHSATVVTLDVLDDWRTDWADHSYYYHSWPPQAIHKADAIITKQRGIALALSFADCTPLTFYDPYTHVIGLAHGGWRGTARGIAIATIEAMQAQFGSQPEDIYAGIGPSIGPCCYEVSPEVQGIFMGLNSFEDMPTQKQYQDMVRESATFSTVSLAGKESLRLDLRATNRRQLLLAGVQPEHIELASICTSCHSDRFFSHRAEHGLTGRFPAIVAMRRAEASQKPLSKAGK